MDITETSYGVWTFEKTLENGPQLKGNAIRPAPDLIEVRVILSGKTLVKGRKQKVEVYEIYDYNVSTLDEILGGALAKIAKHGNYAQRLSKILHQTKKLMTV